MWVYEETITRPDGRVQKLTDIINTEHENVKYLPGFKIPDSVIAVPDLAEAVRGATLLIFVLPHQFLPRILPTIKAAIGEERLASGLIRGLSLIKGLEFNECGLVLISDMIRKGLGISCDVLMGANVANEVAEGQFCEATIGYTGTAEAAEVWSDLIQTRFFRLQLSPDATAVELCGAIKNVIALACGFSDALKYGTNTKAALIRIGAREMLQFIRQFSGAGASSDTMLESCGIADLITTCFGGRNRKCAEAFVLTGKEWHELEVELIGGQKLQGTLTCAEVHKMLERAGCTHQYPLFEMIYAIMTRQLPPHRLVEMHLERSPRTQHIHPQHHLQHTPDSIPVFQPQLPAAVLERLAKGKAAASTSGTAEGATTCNGIGGTA